MEKPLQRCQCRLCHFGASGERAFLDHIVEKHSGGADEGRALIEYRKKVVGLATHLGPSDAWLRVSDGHYGDFRGMLAPRVFGLDYPHPLNHCFEGGGPEKCNFQFPPSSPHPPEKCNLPSSRPGVEVHEGGEGV